MNNMNNMKKDRTTYKISVIFGAIFGTIILIVMSLFFIWLFVAMVILAILSPFTSEHKYNKPFVYNSYRISIENKHNSKDGEYVVYDVWIERADKNDDDDSINLSIYGQNDEDRDVSSKEVEGEPHEPVTHLRNMKLRGKERVYVYVAFSNYDRDIVKVHFTKIYSIETMWGSPGIPGKGISVRVIDA